MKDHPCFRCRMADCDIADRRCLLRRLYGSHQAKARRGARDRITPDERTACREIWQDWRLRRDADASNPAGEHRQ